jgi:putative transcriptional regulator
MKENIITARMQKDGTLIQVLPDGKTCPLRDDTDLKRLEAMTEEEIEAAALSDPDALPITPEDIATDRVRRVPQIKVVRRALGMTQEEFSSRFHLPVGTIRDWEQGRFEPDQAAKAYLHVIAKNPEAVMKAFEQ